MQGDGLQGEVQILHATPEQISQLQHAQHIQILQGDQVIQVPVPVSISFLHEEVAFCLSSQISLVSALLETQQ